MKTFLTGQMLFILVINSLLFSQTTTKNDADSSLIDNNKEMLNNSVKKSPIVDNTYVRIDGDSGGIYVWIGGSSQVGNLSLAHDIIYFPATNYIEADIGSYLTFANGKFDLLPGIGILMNLTTGETEYIIPQLYIFSTISKFYLEIWNFYYYGIITETIDFPMYYGRYISKYSFSDNFAVGPFAEMSIDLSDSAEKEIFSLPIGLIMSWPYGENSTMDISLGIDTKSDNSFTARFTFFRSL